MARARTKTTTKKPTSSMKPLNGKRARPPAPETREDLISDMGKLLDAVDQEAAKMRPLYWTYGGGKWNAFREKMNELLARMEKLLPDDRADEVFAKELAAEPGSEPSIARPGMFVEWIGYVPVLIEWGGFFNRSADLRVVDPTERWISATGFRSLHIGGDGLEHGVRAWTRETLAAAAQRKEFDLFTLSEWGRQEAAERLAGAEWLQRALKAGPVDPIPLPRKLHAVQQSFF